MESSESIPSRYFRGTGTPITGNGVTAASMPGRWAGAVEIIAEGGDMADLASRPHLLAVELHPEPAIPSEAMQQRRRKIIDAATEDIDHHRPRHSGARITQGQIEDRAQVVLELRGV